MDYNKFQEECNNLEKEMEEIRKEKKTKRIKWKDTSGKESCGIFLAIMNNTEL